MIANKKIVIPILNDEYKVVVCWGSKNFVNKVGKDYGYKDNEVSIKDDCRGRIWYEERLYPIIVLHKRPSNPTEVGCLAHESFHAVNYIYHYIGESISGSEIFAHSIASIVRNVLMSK
jgi:hypothetical protein